MYLQTRVEGEKSPRRIPLKATTLEDAKKEVAEIQIKKEKEGLPRTGIRPTFEVYCTEYFDFFDKVADSGKRIGTVTRERTSTEQWKKSIGSVRLDKITKTMIAAFIDERLKAGVKPRTVNVDVIVLRNVLNKALDAGLIAKLPTDGIKPIPVKTPKREMITHANFQALCAAALKCEKNGKELEDYLKFLAYSGARCSEALRIPLSDVDFTQKHVCIGADGLAKNGLHRYVDFTSELEAHLKDMLERKAPDTTWLFPSPQRGKSDKRSMSLRESFNIARKNAELEWVGFHDLRHYFISLAIMSGIDIKTVAEWVGHKDGGVLIGKVYSHLLTDHRKRMARKFVFQLRVAEPEPESAASA